MPNLARRLGSNIIGLNNVIRLNGDAIRLNNIIRLSNVIRLNNIMRLGNIIRLNSNIINHYIFKNKFFNGNIIYYLIIRNF